MGRKANVHAFCEVLLIGDWKEHVSDTLDAIAAHNSSNQPWIGQASHWRD